MLGYLGIYPKPEAFLSVDDPLYESIDDDEDLEDQVVIDWSFKLMTNDVRNKTKADILTNIDMTKYEVLSADVILDDVILNSSYLGFSYIVPMTNDESLQQRFYSMVFHDINQQGVALQGQESRRSLYYLVNDLVPYFEPTPFINMLKIMQGGKARRYDYVRVLSFVTQYKHDNKETSIAVGCRSQEKYELYYEAYINAVVTDENSSQFGKFSTMVGIANIASRTARLKDYVDKLGFNTPFANIIDADTRLFGLVYYVILEDKQLDETKLELLKSALDIRANRYRSNAKHRDAPNGVKYLRARLKGSINTYKSYLL